MTLLLDTNVVLDLLLAREPFAEDAVQIFKLVEDGAIDGLLCATTLTTIDYLLVRSLPRAKAREAVRRLLGLFGVASVDGPVLLEAIESPMQDFEDAVLAHAAKAAGAKQIITRDANGFEKSPVKAISPAEFLGSFQRKTARRKTSGDGGES